MGYTTFRNLHIFTGNHSPREVSIAFEKHFDPNHTGLQTYVSSCIEPEGTLDFDGIIARTWYCEQEEMTEFSRCFPNAVFIMSGEGEDMCDVWERQYKDGRVTQRVKNVSWGDWKNV